MLNRKRGVLFILAIGFIWGIAMAAQAKTPDGATPAEETVCDGLAGPLFGLCNAYCEAMDCGDPNQAASDQSCQRVLDNFIRHSGGDVPPCVAFCPCYTSSEIDATLISDPIACDDSNGTSIEDEDSNEFSVFNDGGWFCRIILEGELDTLMGVISEDEAADCRLQILNSQAWANCP